MTKIVITLTSFGEYDEKPLRLLRDRRFKVALNPYKRKLKRDEVIGLCSDAVGIIAGTETLDREVIERLTNLKVISRCGTGLDNIDLTLADSKGIKIFNTPDAPTSAVAELTIGLILNLLRKITDMHNAVTGGKWEKLMGNLLYGKKVGVIGFGRIGKKVAGLLKAFGCEVSYSDPFVKESSNGLKRRDLKELLGWADIISLHVSYPEKILGKEELLSTKKGAWLVNTSRGRVIDEDALYMMLKSGHLSGAALDVFEEEPYSGPLKDLDNCMLTPHVGSYTRESRSEMELESVTNLLKGLEACGCL